MYPGIVVAMAAEARILAKGLKTAGELIRLPGGAMMFLSGMGASRARLGVRALLENGATALVSWGFAGGLSPALPAGSLVLPQTVIAADQIVYPVDSVWHERLCRRLQGTGFFQGPLADSRAILASRVEKKELFSRTGAIAVDMESASIALFAKKAGVPFMVIRAITDPAEMVIPQSVQDCVDELGRVRLSRLIQGVIKHPMDLPLLVHLGRNFRAARAALAKVAIRVGSKLLCPGEAGK
jgi:adenosylhomocysteine nucleosidase